MFNLGGYGIKKVDDIPSAFPWLIEIDDERTDLR